MSPKGAAKRKQEQAVDAPSSAGTSAKRAQQSGKTRYAAFGAVAQGSGCQCAVCLGRPSEAPCCTCAELVHEHTRHVNFPRMCMLVVGVLQLNVIIACRVVLVKLKLFS